MKKVKSVLTYILFALIVLPPLCVIISSCFGYIFVLANYSVFAIITAILSVCTAVLHIISKKTIESKTSEVLRALLTPLSLTNTVFYIFMSDNITIWIAISMLVCTVCCCFLPAKHGNPLTLKIICLVLSVLSVPSIVFFGLMANIGQDTIVKSVESPNGIYYAEVIDSDEGALGGDTLVDVYENKVIDAFVFKIHKRPQTIYQGEWGEFEDMEIYWKNENCLIINSVEYEIE